MFSRYLNRTATHPVLQVDPDFREFLEREGDLPKATSTSALSGAGVMRLFHRVGDVVEKISFKMDESDEVGLCQPITFLPPVSVCPFYIKPHGIFLFLSTPLTITGNKFHSLRIGCLYINML